MNFDLEALPLLAAMADDDSANGFPVIHFLLEQGLSQNRAERWLDLLREDDYITGTFEKNAASRYYLIHGARLTPRALKQLNLWPSDNERALALVEQVANTLEHLGQADETDDEARPGLKAAGRVVRDFSINLAAGIAVASQQGPS